jgi:hypothetical protein
MSEYYIAFNGFGGEIEDHIDIMRLPQEKGFVNPGARYIIVFRGDYDTQRKCFTNQREIFTRDQNGNIGLTLEDALEKGTKLSKKGNKDLHIKKGLILLLKKYVSHKEIQTGIDEGIREVVFEPIYY